MSYLGALVKLSPYCRAVKREVIGMIVNRSVIVTLTCSYRIEVIKEFLNTKVTTVTV